MIDFMGKLSICSLIKSFIYITKFIASSTPIVATTVELVDSCLFVCLFDKDITAPLQNVRLVLILDTVASYLACSYSFIPMSKPYCKVKISLLRQSMLLYSVITLSI